MNHKFRYINRNLKRKRRNSAIEINSWIYVTLASDTLYSMDWIPLMFVELPQNLSERYFAGRLR